jgi:hypothetical protein
MPMMNNSRSGLDLKMIGFFNRLLQPKGTQHCSSNWLTLSHVAILKQWVHSPLSITQLACSHFWFTKATQAGHSVHAFNPNTWEQKQADLCEFETRPAYIASTRISRDIQRDPLSKATKQKGHSEFKCPTFPCFTLSSEVPLPQCPGHPLYYSLDSSLSCLESQMCGTQSWIELHMWPD